MEMINNSNIYAHKLIAALIPILCRECSRVAQFGGALGIC
jgi:hypothetical protein